MIELWTERAVEVDKLSIMESLNFINEAEAVLKEMTFGMKEGHVSKSLPCSEVEVYINFTTLEGDHYCVHLDHDGYEVGII